MLLASRQIEAGQQGRRAWREIPRSAFKHWHFPPFPLWQDPTFYQAEGAKAKAVAVVVAAS